MKANFNKIIQSETPILIDFFAEWCGPCKTQAPILQQVAAVLGNKIKIIKIDVDKNQQIAQQYRIQSVPTLMICKKGQILYKQAGALPKAQLIQLLEKYI